MDAKLNQSDLSALLAKMCEISVTKADTFTKAFFDVIIEGLENDGIVKINGLGTFKMVDVASRSSVNVNTGEKFEIKGHKKITFLPADSLKEKVNTPFAMFEPVEVDDDYVDEPDSSDEEQTDIAADTTLQTVVAENPQPVDAIAQTVTAENPQPVDAIAQTITAENPQPLDAVAQTVTAENPQLKKENSKPQKHRYIWLTLSIILLAGIFCWTKFADKSLPQSVESVETKITVIEKVETIPVDTTAVTDTIGAEEAVEEIRPFVLLEELAQTELSKISIKDTVDYAVSGIITVHRVGLDETLVKISLSYYNDKRLWPYIVHHNRLKNFNQLEIGMEIEIPRLVPRK